MSGLIWIQLFDTLMVFLRNFFEWADFCNLHIMVLKFMHIFTGSQIFYLVDESQHAGKGANTVAVFYMTISSTRVMGSQM